MSQQPEKTLAVPLNWLRCPACRGHLSTAAGSLTCGCGKRYPIVGQGIPVLIDEDRSLFSIESFIRQESTFFPKPSRLRQVIFGMLPSMSVNRVAAQNYRAIEAILLDRTDCPVVLVVGGGVLGAGMEAFHSNPKIHFIDSDVAIAPLTKLVCDAHEIPFADCTFDAVIVQAVLEHVVDPYRCVDEIHRVLKPDGLVYAETPFMQPAHSTPYDFQRFTFVGYRRLFRRYEQISLGPVGGPAQALGHLFEHALLCVGRSRALHATGYIIARCVAFWWKYLDRLLNRNPHAIHCAFGLFFLGRKVPYTLSDREVIQSCSTAA